MEKEIIHTKNAPEAIGPYSQANRLDNMLYCSGQIPLNPQTMKIEVEDIEEQTQQVLNNLKAVIEAAGSSLDKVVKTTCYLSDLAHFARFNAVYESYFGQSRPARVTIQAAALPLGALVEIDAIAFCH